MFTGVMIFTSCGNSREYTSDDFKKLDQIIQDHYFEIEAEWARPLVTSALIQLDNVGLFAPGDNASQINISGESSHLRFQGVTVIADLPYFGERQMGGGYNNSSGIKFEAKPEELEILKEKTKNQYLIKFNITENTENFKILLIVYPNFKSTLNISSSQRNPISYRGHLNDLKITEEK
ncbi:DUF4251 domain-containing protein [Psychroflexus sediminis]|nr:DUF4251 domain-containing protein [Psychroflexus sediminis]